MGKVGSQEVSIAVIAKITAAALSMMVAEANARTPGGGITQEQIIAAVKHDPLGETAVYLRNALYGGVEWLLKIRATPELLEVFPGHNHVAEGAL